MKNFRKHIDDFFREKLGNYRETPPPEVWDDLETRLDGLVAGAPPFSYRWLRHFAIVSLIVLLGVSVIRKISGNSASENIQSHDKSIAMVPSPSAAGMAGGKNNATGPQTTLAGSLAGKQADENNNDPVIAAQQADKKVNDIEPSGNYKKNNAKHIVSHKQTQGNKYIASKKPRQPAQIENNYQSNASKPGPVEETNENTQALAVNAKTPNVQKQELSAALKKESPADSKKLAGNDPGDAHTKTTFHRFEAGIKGGYERGFYDDAAKKLIVSPYLQYNINTKWAIMTQPAVKYATITTRTIGARSYYKENNDSNATQNWIKTTYIGIGETIEPQYQTNYTYSQTHDSIVKTYTYGGAYMEFEIPLLLKYSITPKVSAYGGVNIDYSKLIGITENTWAKQGIKVSVSDTNTTIGAPAHLPVNSVITYSGNAISNYTGPLYTAQQGSFVRVGYMLGFSYEYTNRWLFDALIQQNPAKPGLQQGNYNNTTTNTMLSSAYFRLSVGYKLIK